MKSLHGIMDEMSHNCCCKPGFTFQDDFYAKDVSKYPFVSSRCIHRFLAFRDPKDLNREDMSSSATLLGNVASG